MTYIEHIIFTTQLAELECPINCFGKSVRSLCKCLQSASLHFAPFIHIPRTNGTKETVKRRKANGVFEWPKGTKGRRERMRQCKLKPHPLLQMLRGNYQPIPDRLPARLILSRFAPILPPPHQKHFNKSA